MNFGTLLFLLILFTIVALYVNRRIQARQQAQADATAGEPTSNQSGVANGLWPRNKEQSRAFRAWAVTAFAGQPAIQRWLAELSDDSIRLLVPKVADFCTDMGFEFNWLLQHTIDQERTLAPRLQAIACRYIETCYEATLLLDEVMAFQSWQEFTQTPPSKAQLALAQRVLAQLIEDGVLPPTTPTQPTAPTREAEAALLQSVREAAESDPAAFRAAWASVLHTPVDPQPSTIPIPDWLKRSWTYTTDTVQATLNGHTAKSIN